MNSNILKLSNGIYDIQSENLIYWLHKSASKGSTKVHGKGRNKEIPSIRGTTFMEIVYLN